MGALPKRKTSTFRKGKRRVDLKRQFAKQTQRQVSQSKRIKNKTV